MVEETYEHIALAMRRISVDFTEVSCDVVRVNLRSRRMYRVDPRGIFRSGPHRVAVLIDAIAVIGGADQIGVMAVVTAAVS
jgi:hypothetical protein